MMQVDSIETPQNQTLHQLPNFAHLAQPAAKYIGKDEWLKLSQLVVLVKNHTSTKTMQIFSLAPGAGTIFYTTDS